MKETKTNHLNNRKGGDCGILGKKGRALQVGGVRHVGLHCYI